MWKTVEVLSFGTLSRLYCNLSDTKTKKLVAREFNLPQHLCMESWLKCLVVLRNHLAHHARLWNRRFPLKPRLDCKMRGRWIAPGSADSAKLYAQLCCVAYLLDNINPGGDFQKCLTQLLLRHPAADPAALGMPDSWRDEPLWSGKA